MSYAIPLAHLLDMPDDLGSYEPLIERAPMERLIAAPDNARAEVKAKAASIAVLMQHGLEASMDADEELVADQEFQHLTRNQPLSSHRVNKPAIVLKLAGLLSEYDHDVVRDAAQMRQYVTNRLIEESDPGKPAGHRLRALDMLGKINGVDLFTERTEITIKTQPLENLEAMLHDKLRVLLPDEYHDIVHQAAAIDVTPEPKIQNDTPDDTPDA